MVSASQAMAQAVVSMREHVCAFVGVAWVGVGGSGWVRVDVAGRV